MKRWKLCKFVKKADEYHDVCKFFEENYYWFKEIYANMSLESADWPGITNFAFSDFCMNAKLIDRNFNLSAVDRLCIAANYDDSDEYHGDYNATQALIRFELLEVLVRIVKAKYLEP